MKILVANRGEIAIRIIEAAIDLGYQTVAIYSNENDRNHCDVATESIKIPADTSFMNTHHIMTAAKSVHATAIHPGYGFLSESAELADQCQKNGIIFIGPSIQCIASVSDKVSARMIAEEVGVPVIPGTKESVSSVDHVYDFAHQFGYPIMLKARDGGGGRGIRMVHSADQLPDLLNRCLNESPSRQVFVEKAVVNAKHIEVQILGDHYGNIIHLLERDCSAQRRYQKILEIAPCSYLPPKLRSLILDAALKLAFHIKYDSAGTIEFLVYPDLNEFYFLEINPRIQVEHTISEQITQVDIVQAQIQIAHGQRLSDMNLKQSSNELSKVHLVSIQARIVAENPMKNNMLCVGKLKEVIFPHGAGVRIDTWIKPGTVILPTFDSLLAKMIVTGVSYEDALSKLRRALRNTVINGIETNICLLRALVSDHSLRQNDLTRIHINSIEDNMNDLLQITSDIHKTQEIRPAEITSLPSIMQFKPGDGFDVHIEHPTSATYSFQIESITQNNFPDQLSASFQTSLPSITSPLSVSIMRRSIMGSSTIRRKANSHYGHTEIGSPLTGMIVEINVEEGEEVIPGKQLFVISAMKMETVISSTITGRVNKKYVCVHDMVESGDVVVELTQAKDSKL